MPASRMITGPPTVHHSVISTIDFIARLMSVRNATGLSTSPRPSRIALNTPNCVEYSHRHSRPATEIVTIVGTKIARRYTCWRRSGIVLMPRASASASRIVSGDVITTNRNVAASAFQKYGSRRASR
jgi:hypothetical protein